MAESLRSVELAAVVRSKNAGPFHLTIDLFYDSTEAYAAAKKSGELDAELFASLYRVPLTEVEGPYWDDAARGVKVTVPKHPSSGEPRCTDLMGAHLHIPLVLARRR